MLLWHFGVSKTYNFSANCSNDDDVGILLHKDGGWILEGFVAIFRDMEDFLEQTLMRSVPESEFKRRMRVIKCMFKYS